MRKFLNSGLTTASAFFALALLLSYAGTAQAADPQNPAPKILAMDNNHFNWRGHDDRRGGDRNWRGHDDRRGGDRNWRGHDDRRGGDRDRR